MKYLYLILCLLFFNDLSAQYHLEQYDIHIGPKYSNPVFFEKFQKKIYFYAADKQHGHELRVLDNGKVSLVADIWKGVDNSSQGSMSRMVSDDNYLYFAANDSISGLEIFRYDGINPPHLYIDIDKRPTEGTYPFLHFVHDNRLYFSAVDPPSGEYYLFYYDMNNNNLHKLSNNFTAVNKGIFADVYKGNVYFNSPKHGTGFHELAIYNPKTDTTVYLNDISQTPGIHNVWDIKTIGDYIYFIGNEYGTPGLGNLYSLYQFNGKDSLINITSQISANHGIFSTHSKVESCFEKVRGEIIFTTYNKQSNQNDIYTFNPVLNTIRLLKQNSGQMSSYINYNNYILCNYKDVSAPTGKTHIYNLSNDPVPFFSIVSGLSTASMTWAKSIDNKLYFGGYIKQPTPLGTELNVLSGDLLSTKEVISNSLPITLYPNPTTGDAELELTLDDPQALSVQITDITGKVVFRNKSTLYGAGKQKISLSTASLHVGTYIITIVDERLKTVSSGKLLKE